MTGRDHACAAHKRPVLVRRLRRFPRRCSNASLAAMSLYLLHPLSTKCERVVGGGRFGLAQPTCPAHISVKTFCHLLYFLLRIVLGRLSIVPQIPAYSVYAVILVSFIRSAFRIGYFGVYRLRSGLYLSRPSSPINFSIVERRPN
jgi:hypothetical protein